MRRVNHLLFESRRIDLFRVSAVERRQSSHQFIEESSKAVEIGCKTVPLPRYDFRRHVLRTATEGIGSRTIAFESWFDKTEVSQVNLTLSI